ncbi:MAG: hypothetical protein KJ653_04840 [Candidatus Thermoplasmatota archaeon]|nr:hypothetical protein [Candidatus Thermoplasmatota archaeon]
MENLDKAMFCEKCGIRLVLPPIEAQPEILNTGQGNILGIVPRVALVPVLGMVIGAFAVLFYLVGFFWAANTISNPDFNPFNSDSTSSPEAMMILAAVLGMIAAVVFWGGVIAMVLQSD